MHSMLLCRYLFHYHRGSDTTNAARCHEVSAFMYSPCIRELGTCVEFCPFAFGLPATVPNLHLRPAASQLINK